MTKRFPRTGIGYDVIAGILLIMTVILNPEGVVGPAHELIESRRAKKRSASTAIHTHKTL